jgi:hypothetical protein
VYTDGESFNYKLKAVVESPRENPDHDAVFVDIEIIPAKGT